MAIWDWIALITGILGVLLTIRQNIWCWPMALIAVVISIVAFYKARLFGDMFLNVFYFFSGVYGWYYWHQKKEEEFNVTHVPRKQIWILVVMTIIQIVVYYYILHYFKSDQIIYDAILTACSFTCTYMMVKKWVENWAFWFIIDSAYVGLYFIKDMPTYALLYGFYSLMVIYGFWQWKKQIKA